MWSLKVPRLVRWRLCIANEDLGTNWKASSCHLVSALSHISRELIIM